MKKFNATVINDVWPEVFFFSLIATSEIQRLFECNRVLMQLLPVVSLVTDKAHSLAISNQLLTVLGTVLGLVISFRTSSAYER